MISNRCDFLIIHYAEIDFLFNRNQVVGSVSNIEEDEIESSIPYLNSVVRYGSRTLLSVNLDLFLRNIFLIPDEPTVRFSVIVDYTVFSKNNQDTIASIIENEQIECDKRFISFSLTSHSEIRKIDILTLKLMPDLLRSYYHTYGLFGCRFVQSNRVQYYTDLENLFFNAVLNLEKSR
jgi:hypothetical protein